MAYTNLTGGMLLAMFESGPSSIRNTDPRKSVESMHVLNIITRCSKAQESYGPC